MERTHSKVLPVITERGSAELVSHRALRRVPRAFWDTTQVRDIMTENGAQWNLSELPESSLSIAERTSEHALPVCAEGQPIGVLELLDPGHPSG
jgi:hypothetical protein